MYSDGGTFLTFSSKEAKKTAYLNLQTGKFGAEVGGARVRALRLDADTQVPGRNAGCLEARVEIYSNCRLSALGHLETLAPCCH